MSIQNRVILHQAAYVDLKVHVIYLVHMIQFTIITMGFFCYKSQSQVSFSKYGISGSTNPPFFVIGMQLFKQVYCDGQTAI